MESQKAGGPGPTLHSWRAVSRSFCLSESAAHPPALSQCGASDTCGLFLHRVNSLKWTTGVLKSLPLTAVGFSPQNCNGDCSPSRVWVSPGTKRNCHEWSQALGWLRCSLVDLAITVLADQRWPETSSLFPSALGLQALCCCKAQLNIALPLWNKIRSRMWSLFLSSLN